MRYIAFSSQNAAEKQRRRALARQARRNRRVRENLLLRSNTPEGNRIADNYVKQTVRESRQDRIRKLATEQRQKARPVVDIRPKVDTRPRVDVRPTVNAKPKVDVLPPKPPVNPQINTPSQKQIKTPGNSFIKKAFQNKYVRRGAFGLGGLGVLAGGAALTMGALNRRKRKRQSR